MASPADMQAQAGQFALIMQWVGGGTIISIAFATLKVLRDSRDELRDLRRDLGRADQVPATGVLGRLAKLEDEHRTVRDWMIANGFDRRHRDRAHDSETGDD